MAYLPDDVLIKLLPASFEPWGSSSWYPSQPPTKKSLERIREVLGIEIPTVFVRIAQACQSYGGWFGSIGEDFDSGNHIIAINAVFHESGIPAQYILFNHGHDGDCDAWDAAAPKENGEFPVVYISLNDDNSIDSPKLTHTSFRAYIDEFCRKSAPECPVKPLRNEAKRILAAYGEASAA